ncbi:MAG: methanol--corrinoid methyltransferase [Oscillospiraceae bacterium]|jgi:methanol--5-hydroxybenzimidazolylcobamide Co-methyltransferase|nr:methanol--corrinoid methyltransferase [Oscillospiraceae bacterium]
MQKKRFTSTAYAELSDFLYGSSPYPVTLANGLSVGGGLVYPEINFTLPPMLITKDTMPEVIANYKQIAEGICQRARELYAPGFVAEIETLPPMTENPEWGIEVCKTVVDIINEHGAKHGIKGAVRITPNDIREGTELEHMWRGAKWERMLRTFEGCAKAGADFLAIESVGGKETHDEAVMYCDIAKSIFALSVLGTVDMAKLWAAVTSIADNTGAVPSGDTACGFGNTAMVLADKNYIPRVFAATVRVVSAVRSLVAYEYGARGPHKDCGYEGVYVKAITGTPISMEGRTAACAHLSPVGNVAFCLADLWSNESVQNIKLLGGMAPTVSFEQLVYDCRLANEASARGKDAALLLRDLHADSDSKLDPQAYVLRPDVALAISKELVKVEGYYPRAKKAAALALEYMEKASRSGELTLSAKELTWLDNLTETVAELPGDVGEFTENIIGECEKLDPKKYDM